MTESGFTRKASGLVRSWSPFDAWIYNIIAINIVVNVAVSYAFMATIYPRASQWLAFVIAGVFCTVEAIVYVFFTTAMPRSGGDYVFQSRVLGGAWASIFAFAAVTLSQVIWMALAAWVGANIILSPFMTLLGAYYNADWMTRNGVWWQTNWGIFIMGCVITLWAAFVNIRGMRLYALLQRWFFALGIGTLLIVLIALLFTSQSTFINNLNSFMASHYHVNHAYAQVIAKGGSTNTSFSLQQTLLAVVVASFALIYPAWGVQQAGEIKRANSLQANTFAIVGAELFSFVIVAITAALLVSRVGTQFLYSAGSLPSTYASGANPLPVPAFFGFFTALLVNNAFFTWIVFLLFFSWFWMWFTNITLGGTRVMIAMAFDRVLPEFVGQVNKRTHTPINAILVFSAACIVVTTLYAFDTNFVRLTLGLTVLNITGFAVTMLAGALFPWLKKDLYESTVVAKYKLGAVPLITICGAIFLAFAVFVDFKSLTASELGINGHDGLGFVFGTYAVAIVIYLAALIYRRFRDHLDLGMVYRELPAE
jgi:amino acid transporter